MAKSPEPSMVALVLGFGKGMIFLIAAAAGALGACGAPPPCSSSALCPEGTVCGATGACLPLDPAAGRFARALWVTAQDWAESGRERTEGDTDLLVVGGEDGQIAYLSFGPLPAAGRIESAILVLWPHETWDPPRETARVGAYPAAAFEGPFLDRRNIPRTGRRPLSETGIAPGATRALRFDVTAGVAAARDREETEVSLAISSGGDEALPLRFASPRSLAPRRRPRLELTVR